MTRCKKMLSAAFLIFITVIMATAPIAAQNAPQIIRVGCIDLHNFIDHKKNGDIDGYGATYLKEIAKYTNWKYEYVFGNWSECLEWLKEGKIDLLFPAEYTKARGEEYLFSKYSVCTDYATLSARKDNADLFYEDYASFSRIRVGMIRGNFLNEQFMKFAKQHNFTPRYVYYDNLNELTQALESAAVDTIINGNLNTAQNQKILAKFSIFPTYFIMPKQHTALMEALNDAMHHILLDNPYFIASLNERFYTINFLHATGFTREESAYIQSQPPLNVVYAGDHYPYCWYDSKTKQFRGVYPDILKIISRETGLQFNLRKAETPLQALTMLQNRAADILLNSYDGVSDDSSLLVYTSAYTTEEYTPVGKHNRIFDPEDAHIAAIVRHNQNLQNYLRQMYPHWKILFCETDEDCLDQVSDGVADLAFLDTSRLSNPASLPGYTDIGIIPTFLLDIPISLGVHNQQDTQLRSILEKSIHQLTKKELNQCILNNTFLSPPKLTLRYLIQYYTAEAAAAVLFIFLLLTAGLIILYREHLKAKQSVSLMLKNSQLSETAMLAEHAGKAHELYETLYNSVPFGILQYEFNETTHEFSVLYTNNGAHVILKNASKKLFDQASAKTMKRIHQMIAALQNAGDRVSFEEEISFSDASVWISGMNELLARANNKKIIQSTFMDMTHQKLLENELLRRSETDALTSLLNKAAAETACRRCIAEKGAAEALTLMIIDIDHFKEINDSFGHQYGDETLRNFAALLRNTFRKEDIVGRIGGDEFIVLLKNTSDRVLIAEKAKKLCLKANALLQKSHPRPFSCSIGIAVKKAREALPYEELFEKADHALYETKRAGRNGWTFAPNGEE